MVKWLVLFLLVLAMPVAWAIVPADAAAPQIVEKPLIVNLGEQVTLDIYNGGHEVWTDLYVSVADGPLQPVSSLIGPEEFLTVTLDAPLALFLESDELGVSLWSPQGMLEERVLPVRVSSPLQTVFVDTSATGSPEFVVVIDPADRPLGRVQVEVALERDGKVLYFDFFGPFVIDDGLLIFRSPVPAGYIASGSYELHATFYAGGDVFAETRSAVSFTGERVSFAPLVVVFLALIFIVVLYLLIDMIYYSRTMDESWHNLR